MPKIRITGLYLVWLLILSWLFTGRAAAQTEHHLPWIGYPPPSCKVANMICNLTGTSTWETFYTWSPDGSKIAFVLQSWGTTPEDIPTPGIYVINADGTQAVKLLDHAYEPAWSPDGTKIAYSYRGHIYVMDADGSNMTSLRGQDINQGQTPVWSPDGSKIAYHSFTQIDLCCDIAPDLYVMNADGSHQIKLASDVALSPPSWSPDSSKIAAGVYKIGIPPDIHVINADGSGSVNLTNSPVVDTGPSWSPDGSRIAFLKAENNRMGLYTMKVDGSNIISLTDRTFQFDANALPRWSPDGSKILFQTLWDSHDVHDALYLINPTGNQNPQRIYSRAHTTGGGFGWSPNGSKIAFTSESDIYILDVME